MRVLAYVISRTMINKTLRFWSLGPCQARSISALLFRVRLSELQEFFLNHLDFSQFS